MKTIRQFSMLVLLVVALSGCAGLENAALVAGQGQARPLAAPPLRQPAAGPAPLLAVGAQAPDFTLLSGSGAAVHLAEALRANTSVVLVFYSGHYCRVCLEMLRQYDTRRAALAARGVRLMAIATQSVDEAAGTARDTDVRYAVLADPQADVAYQYGVQRMLPGKPKVSQSPVSIFVIRSDGLITWSGPVWITEPLPNDL